ncbi:hypothetical protein CCH79_00002987 [Gambusia affinis]|uniref:Uncharacterized protein n=1 Tax=Gambusia affinis TaxID=33528 RepID=A0A315W6V3_GAMAF|nr:hypothetical protein CCH79_00002987 [Gambusia affinis]
MSKQRVITLACLAWLTPFCFIAVNTILRRSGPTAASEHRSACYRSACSSVRLSSTAATTLRKTDVLSVIFTPNTGGLPAS